MQCARKHHSIIDILYSGHREFNSPLMLLKDCCNCTSFTESRWLSSICKLQECINEINRAYNQT